MNVFQDEGITTIATPDTLGVSPVNPSHPRLQIFSLFPEENLLLEVWTDAFLCYLSLVVKWTGLLVSSPQCLVPANNAMVRLGRSMLVRNGDLIIATYLIMMDVLVV